MAVLREWPLRVLAANSSLLWVLLACLLGCTETVEHPEKSQLDQVHVPGLAAPSPAAEYVGSETCSGCHSMQSEAWAGSHHQLAMATADDETVVGDFSAAGFDYHGTTSTFSKTERGFVVRTDAASGDLRDFTVRYTFGVYPLQQYLLEGADGRLQALGIAWDARDVERGGQRWYHLYPDEKVNHDHVLHWTGPGATWNFMCADCHSTALRKNYDRQTMSYDTSFAELSVGCEACHGPGSEHVNSAGKTRFADLANQPTQISACAPCHSRRSQLAEGIQPGDDFFDFYSPSLLDQGLYFADGQILDEVYVYGSFLQSSMHGAGVACSDCHDPHSAQVRISGDGLCTQCHSPAGRPDFPSVPVGDFASAEHHFHETPIACVDCHMPATTYMGIDDRRDHSFRIPRPDLSVRLGIPNACGNCHREEGAQWAADAVEQRVPGPRGPHFADAFAAGRAADPAAEAQLVTLAEDDTRAPIVRATAMALLATYERRMSSVVLEAGLKHDNPLIRIGALRGARRWAPEVYYSKARRLLDDATLAVRVEAMQGLVAVYPALSDSRQAALRPRLLEYLQILDFNADVAQGLSNMAAVHMALQDIPSAEAALRQALELQPKWVPGLVNLADLYRATGRDVMGGELLSRALSLSRDNADVLLAKALWDVRQGDTPSAVELLTEAWQLDRFNPRYAYVYMIALDSVGRSEEALEVAATVLSRRNDQQIRQVAGNIRAKLGAGK